MCRSRGVTQEWFGLHDAGWISSRAMIVFSFWMRRLWGCGQRPCVVHNPTGEPSEPGQAARTAAPRELCHRRQWQLVKIGTIGRPSTKARMRTLAVVEIQIAAERGPRRADAIVGSQIGEWRGASQPRALSEPDVNLSIHPAPIIQPLVPVPSGRTGSGCGAEANATIPRPPSCGPETACICETPIAR